MSRVIKFRYVWKRESSIATGTYTMDEIDGGTPVAPVTNRVKWGLTSRDEFTGLKDKNGVEIYEGDLYDTTVLAGHPTDRWGGEYWVKVTAKVGFFNGRFVGFVASHTKSSFEPEYKKGYFDGRIAEIKDIEVIGNIHQNPELLK